MAFSVRPNRKIEPKKKTRNADHVPQSVVLIVQTNLKRSNGSILFVVLLLESAAVTDDFIISIAI